MERVSLPLGPAQKLEIKKKSGYNKIEKIEAPKTGKFTLGSGNYIIIV